MTIGNRIKQRRLELGLTQTELAHRLGLKSKVSISTVENDKEDLTTDRIRKFADALNTTPGYLMGWEAADESALEPIPSGDREEAQYVKEYYKLIKLYELYRKASPEVQKAVELLLKADKQ